MVKGDIIMDEFVFVCIYVLKVEKDMFGLGVKCVDEMCLVMEVVDCEGCGVVCFFCLLKNCLFVEEDEGLCMVK